MLGSLQNTIIMGGLCTHTYVNYKINCVSFKMFSYKSLLD